MGLLDIFKKKEKNNNEIIENKAEQPKQDDYKISLMLENGSLKVEFYERQPKFGQFYDTTRLIIDRMNEQDLADCRVSWYGEDDSIVLDKHGNDLGRREAYKNILTHIDIELLQKDKNYTKALMKDLLNQSRVLQYLQEGLKDNPERPCGKYVGSIQNIDGQYRKIFDPNLGQMSHNSPEMVDKRQKYQEMMQESRNRKIERKRNEINRINGEIDLLSR